MAGRTYSIRKRSRRALLFFSGGLILFLLLFSLISSRILFEYTMNQTRQMLSMYDTQVSASLRSVDYYLMDITNYSTDISFLAVQPEGSTAFSSVSNIENLLSFNLHSFPEVLCLYGYFPKNGIFIYQSLAINSYRDNIHELRTRFREDAAAIDSIPSNVRSWQIVQLGGRPFFLKLYRQPGVYLGAFTTPEILCEGLEELNRRNSLIFYVDDAGTPVAWQDEKTASLVGDMRFPADDRGYSILKIGGTRYLTVRSDLSYCDFDLLAMVPVAEVNGPLRSLTFLVLAMILVAIAFSAFFIFYTSSYLTKPVQLISDASAGITAGSLETGIETEGIRAREMLDISDSINHLIASLRQSKIDIYEEQLEKDRIEMAYLQSQLSPHFLINCLNMIRFLADGTKEHADLMQRMISELSSHLRYTLKKRDAVPLSEEISFVKNYIDMTCIRFPGCLDTTIEADEDIEDAAVFPLIILMHPENTFKYNLVMGEKLSLIIRITGRREEDGRRRVHITHIDSGSGFTPDILATYQGEGTPEPAHERAHIGIRNGMRRLALYYGGDAGVTLSNEPGMGARIDVDIPYIPYSEAAAKTAAAPVRSL